MIKTASWFTPLPAGHIRIGISRGVPRSQTSGFRMYRRLAPGPWFKTASTERYIERFNREILSVLDPEQVLDDLEAAAGGLTPVLCCYEKPSEIQAGRSWCHRHFVAGWMEAHLNILVEEVGFPALDRFRAIRSQFVDPPDYRR